LNTKLKCLLLDDELPGLTYLKMLCEQLPELEVVKAFNNPETFLKEMPELDFDLCILDINMPVVNGLQIADLLDSKMVIFTTAYKEYAAEAFDLDAVDYVRKPVKRERLQQAVQKALKRVSSTDSTTPIRNFIQLNTDRGKALIFFDQLCYIRASESDSRDKTALMQDGTRLLLKNISFDKLKKLLPVDQFVRVNKREMLAFKIVKVFSFDEITTSISDSCGKPIVATLSDAYRNDFIKLVRI